MNDPDWLVEAIQRRREQGLERVLQRLPAVGGVLHLSGRRYLNFASNDYLDLSRDERVIEGAAAALRTYGAGATASRLMTGNLDVTEELEAALARHKGYPSSLVFGSGYLSNLGVITGCIGKKDVAIVDRLVHACVLDGVQLSGARLVRFHHNDTDHLQKQLARHRGQGRCLVVTESLFSMDGDLAPLSEMVGLTEKHDALLLVDEAHATGVFGPAGGGRVAELGLQDRVPLCMATLSKGLGNYGGFVACSTPWRHSLIQTARSLIYTTALPPAVLGGALAALNVLQEEPGRGQRLLDHATFFRDELQKAGLDTGRSESQIVPVHIGDNHTALTVSERLADEGILAVAIRPPTVPPNTARLRLSVTLAHTEEDLRVAAALVARVVDAARPAA